MPTYSLPAMTIELSDEEENTLNAIAPNIPLALIYQELVHFAIGKLGSERCEHLAYEAKHNLERRVETYRRAPRVAAPTTKIRRLADSEAHFTAANEVTTAT